MLWCERTPGTMSIIVIAHHIFVLLFPLQPCYHFGTIYRTLWGSKHGFHGNITETHIDKRIGASVFLWWRMKPQKLRGLQLAEQLNTVCLCWAVCNLRDPRKHRHMFDFSSCDKKVSLICFCHERTLALPDQLSGQQGCCCCLREDANEQVSN